jgi:LmbE family N-acetylglucosaminyl deacetylase
MPISVDSGEAQFVTVVAADTLQASDYRGFVAEFERLVGERGTLRILFDARELKGWDRSALWQEVKFDAQHLAEIERLAMVGAHAWHHAIEAFFKPFARPKMRYFDASEMAQAREWVAEA